MTWDTAGKLAGNILNGLGMYRVGSCLVLCPYPCDVLVMYLPRTPPLAPSVSSPAISSLSSLLSLLLIALTHEVILIILPIETAIVVTIATPMMYA